MPVLQDFIGGKIPQDLLDELKVLERIQFPLRPTSTSAVSTSGETLSPDPIASGLLSMVNHVANMESIVKDMEDAIDLLTQNMNIPASNLMIAAAAKQLGSPDGSITRSVFDTAQAIIDHIPMLTGQGDPVLGALTGDGAIDGPWINCDAFTAGIASTFTSPPSKSYSASDTLKSQANKALDDENTKHQNMVLEILLMLFWNMLWAKFLVDMSICTPLLLIVRPIDAIILFLTNWWPKRPSDNDITNKGPLSQLILKLRYFLLCSFPPKYYPRYKPMVDNLDCKKDNIGPCPQSSDPSSEGTTGSGETGGGSVSAAFTSTPFSPPCIDSSNLNQLPNAQTTPQGLGTSPDCMQAAQVVLNAVIEDALTPKDSQPPSSLSLMQQAVNNSSFSVTPGGV